MTPHTPSSCRYFVGSLLGSLAGAVVLVVAGGSSLEHNAVPMYFSLVVFLTPFLFAPFLLVGWPLFLLLRGTRWFRFPAAAAVGAVVGIASTVPFGGPDLDLVSLAFPATGALSTAVCWWFMSIRPNFSLNADAADKAARAG